MEDRSNIRTQRQPGEAPPSFDEDLEEAVEESLDEIVNGAEDGELEESLEGALDREEEEPETAETEQVIEAELESEDRVAIDQEALVEALLRQTGVLPPESEIGAAGEEAHLAAPRRPDEFVCVSCRLIKPRTQLGDANGRICRDCLDPPLTGPGA